MKYCPKCRTEYRDGFSICADCQAELVGTLPPEEVAETVVPKKDVRVFSSTYSFEANLIFSILESNGLHPFIQDEHTVQMQPLYSYAIGGVKVFVPEDEAANAKELIDDYMKTVSTTNDEEEPDKPEIKKDQTACPRCGKDNIAVRYDVNMGLLLLYILSLVGLFLLLFTPKVYTCMHCGKKWKI